MHTTTLRLGLALVWGVVGAGLLTRHWWDHGRLDARHPDTDFTLFGAVALALCAFNLLRLLRRRSQRSQVSLREEVARRRPPREVVNPELDVDPPPGA